MIIFNFKMFQDDYPPTVKNVKLQLEIRATKTLINHSNILQIQTSIQILTQGNNNNFKAEENHQNYFNFHLDYLF